MHTSGEADLHPAINRQKKAKMKQARAIIGMKQNGGNKMKMSSSM